MEDNEQCEGALSDDVMVLQSVRFGPLHLSSALQLFCSVFSPSFLVNLSFSHCQSFHSFPSKQIFSPPSFLSASFNLIPALLSLSSLLPLLHRNLHFWRTCFSLQALPVPVFFFSIFSLSAYGYIFRPPFPNPLSFALPSPPSLSRLPDISSFWQPHQSASPYPSLLICLPSLYCLVHYPIVIYLSAILPDYHVFLSSSSTSISVAIVFTHLPSPEYV